MMTGLNVPRRRLFAWGLGLALVAAWAVMEATASAETPAVLAASWQPAFCETARSKPECRSQTRARYDATHFALHGLWPQPRRVQYCDIPSRMEEDDRRGRWRSLPALDLTRETRARLERVMPGTQSGLHRHEWVKHGSCYGTPESYFRVSLDLMDALNASPVRDLFANRIGDRLDARTIRAAFDRAFGAGAGERVRVACKTRRGQRMITELTIGLLVTSELEQGPVTAESLGAAILSAPTTKVGCPGGFIDRAG